MQDREETIRAGSLALAPAPAPSTSILSPVTVVATAEEFQAAVVAGARHIEIQAHLDLTPTALLRYEGISTDLHLGNVPSSVRSITVRHLS